MVEIGDRDRIGLDDLAVPAEGEAGDPPMAPLDEVPDYFLPLADDHRIDLQLSEDDPGTRPTRPPTYILGDLLAKSRIPGVEELGGGEEAEEGQIPRRMIGPW